MEDRNKPLFYFLLICQLLLVHPNKVAVRGSSYILSPGLILADVRGESKEEKICYGPTLYYLSGVNFKI